MATKQKATTARPAADKSAITKQPADLFGYLPLPESAVAELRAKQKTGDPDEWWRIVQEFWQQSEATLDERYGVTFHRPGNKPSADPLPLLGTVELVRECAGDCLMRLAAVDDGGLSKTRRAIVLAAFGGRLALCLRSIDAMGEALPDFPEAAKSVADLRRGLRAIVVWCDGKQQFIPIFDEENGVLVLENGPVALEANEQDVLKPLVKERAMTLQNLRRASGCEHPDRILRRLQTKDSSLEEHIRLPGGKGHGGYSTTIRSAE